MQKSWLTNMTELLKATGWRKRQANEIVEKIRNDTLEEVALEFDRMKSFGDTAHSFATFVRGMKNDKSRNS